MGHAWRQPQSSFDEPTAQLDAVSKNERIAVLSFLLALLAAIVWYRPLASPTSEVDSVAYGSLVLLSLTVLLLEHFFAKPTDVIAAGVSVLLLLIPSESLFAAWGIWYEGFFYYTLSVIVMAIAALLLLDSSSSANAWRNRTSRVLKAIATHIGRGKALYLMLFLLILFFYGDPQSSSFILLGGYAGLVAAIEPSRLTLALPSLVTHRAVEIGEIMGVQGESTFLVRLHERARRPPLKRSNLVEFVYGMEDDAQVRRGLIIERYYLDQAQWIHVLADEQLQELTTAVEPLPSHRSDAVYKRDSSEADSFSQRLVGVVAEGSDIGRLRFIRVGRAEITEGDLVQVNIHNRRILYQITDAEVDIEPLESKNEAGRVYGEATQLGVWDAERRTFDRFGWVPSAYSTVVIAEEIDPPPLLEEELQIGNLPATSFPVRLNRRELVSHHTAVVGVTGAGKSVFARQLIRDLSDDPDLRFICVDFTQEWAERFPDLNPRSVISESEQGELFDTIDTLVEEEAKFRNNQRQSVIIDAKERLRSGFAGAIGGFLRGDDSLSVFELPDVSNTEAILEYTRWFFDSLFLVARREANYGRRVCVVLEEAHTVVPEWNFIGLGDKRSL